MLGNYFEKGSPENRVLILPRNKRITLLMDKLKPQLAGICGKQLQCFGLEILKRVLKMLIINMVIRTRLLSLKDIYYLLCVIEKNIKSI